MLPSIPLDQRGATEVAPSLWRRMLAGIAGAARTILAPGSWHRHARHELPIFRISRVWEDRWIVTRPGALIGHAFPDLASAAGFVRHECTDAPAAVELYIGDLYVVAFHDPHKPAPLFGESLGAGRRPGR
jgi:hypothetical protein